MRISDRSSDVCSSDLFGTQQIIDVGVEIEPARPVPHAQYDRRAVMDVAECPRRLRHHCKALDLAIRIAPRPAPQTGKADRFAISRRAIEFGLGLALPFPFHPAIGGDAAAPPPDRLATQRYRLHYIGRESCRERGCK